MPERIVDRVVRAARVAASAPVSTAEWTQRVLTIAVVLVLAGGFYLAQQMIAFGGQLRQVSIEVEKAQDQLDRGRAERLEFQEQITLRECLGLRSAGVDEQILTNYAGCPKVIP